MSDMSLASDRFWNQFKSDVAETLSDAQKQEIERVLATSATPLNEKLSDLRLSFKWFFVRLVWGPEKPSPERVMQEQKTNPLMARLASLFAGYMAFWYAALAVATLVFLYLFN